LVLVYNRDVDVSKVVMGYQQEWGKDILIPGMILNKSDGEKIKQYMKDNKDGVDIQIILDYTVQQAEIVKYNIYYINPYSQNIYPLLADLKDMHVQLGDMVKFEPKVITHRNLVKHSREDCIGEGKYCNYDKDWFYETNGRNVLIHNIKEKCVWSLLKNNTAYFEYIQEFTQCGQSEESKDQCFNKTIGEQNLITIQDVENCFASNISVMSILT
jgi:hypothetical protein